MTAEITEAEYEIKAVEFEDAKDGKISSRRKLILKDGFVYIPALNKKNAIKRLKKLGYTYPD